jgi:hypothetical protein
MKRNVTVRRFRELISATAILLALSVLYFPLSSRPVSIFIFDTEAMHRKELRQVEASLNQEQNLSFSPAITRPMGSRQSIATALDESQTDTIPMNKESKLIANFSSMFRTQMTPASLLRDIDGKETTLAPLAGIGTKISIDSTKTVFQQNHSCARHNVTASNVEHWRQLSQQENEIESKNTKESFLTITTVLGGWVKVDQVREWILWHHHVIGADKFVFYLIHADDSIRDLLTGMRTFKGLDIRLTTVTETARFWDASVNNPRIIKRIEDIFARAVRLESARTEWLACIDIDEFIAPGTAASQNYTLSSDGWSFRAWLKALPTEVDWIYLRWVWFPVSDYTDGGHNLAQNFLPSAITHTAMSRVADAAVKKMSEANSGKSIIRPAHFSGLNSIHHFTPKNATRYNSLRRKIVPSSNTPVLPKNCNSWETGGLKRPQACRREKDVFVLHHYRRKSFNHRPRHDKKRPQDLNERFLVDEASMAMCYSIAFVCGYIATSDEAAGSTAEVEASFPPATVTSNQVANCQFAKDGRSTSLKMLNENT